MYLTDCYALCPNDDILQKEKVANESFKNYECWQAAQIKAAPGYVAPPVVKVPVVVVPPVAKVGDTEEEDTPFRGTSGAGRVVGGLVGVMIVVGMVL